MLFGCGGFTGKVKIFLLENLFAVCFLYHKSGSKKDIGDIVRFNILLSCMHEKNNALIDVSNIRTDAVIVNQCDEDKEYVIEKNGSVILWIDSTERGASRSRNTAICRSSADICLLADNDETFADDVENKILGAYEELPEADLIIFRLSNKPTKVKKKIYKLSRLEMLRVCTWQISFRRQRILEKGIEFDTKLGPGTGNGSGEENKFLFDCYDRGLKIYSYPIDIAYMRDNESTWFFGFNEEFFYERGMVTRYILGLWLSVLYAVYYLVFKYKLYRDDIAFVDAARCLFRGIIKNELNGE